VGAGVTQPIDLAAYRRCFLGTLAETFLSAQAMADLAVAFDEIERLRHDLDEAQLRSIEARNPGIDIEEVRRFREGVKAERTEA